MTRALVCIASIVVLAGGATAEVTSDEFGHAWRDGVGPFVEVSFLIVKSTPSYDEALAFTQKLEREIDIPVDLRGLIHDPSHGLTRPADECANGSYSRYPCYVARGRHDSGRYLSIERSDAYESFAPGLYVVLASSGPYSVVAKQLPFIRKSVPDAYVKSDEVYFGCMH